MENITILTQEKYKLFARRHSKVSFIIIRICYSILLAFGLLELFGSIAQSKEIDIFFVTYCLVCSLLFILYDIFFVKINLKIMKQKIFMGCNYKFTFNDEGMEIETLKDGKTLTKESFNYDLIYKVKVYPDAIYIYINRMNAYIIDINGFTSEESKNKVLQKLQSYVK